ncbi:hypothetical protein [Nocardia sp. NPDC047648]|uniref:hypothetical protein n=1 Tax=Nocardia sp. NPDC047648 TaxID=3155625 RepID=UPI0033CDBE98
MASERQQNREVLGMIGRGRVDAAEHDVRDRAAESDELAARTKVVVATVGPYLR